MKLFEKWVFCLLQKIQKIAELKAIGPQKLTRTIFMIAQAQTIFYDVDGPFKTLSKLATTSSFG